MDSVIVRVLAIVLLLLGVVVAVQRVQVVRLQHRLELVAAERDHAAQVAALHLKADSVARATIERERLRTQHLQHLNDSLTNLLRHVPTRPPARPATATGLRDAILRAAGTP